MIDPPSAQTAAPETQLDPSQSQSLLIVTIDTEAGTSRMQESDRERAVAEHVFGDFGDGRRLGIDLHMDLLEQVGFRGCFFIDILFEYEFGREALERTIEAIQRRGHEIQLHLHSHRLSLAADPKLQEVSNAIYGNDPEPFRRALAHSVDIFTERVGQPPVAYRSGGYNICDAFLKVLPEFGLTIDSSLNPFKNWRVSPWMRTRTQPFRFGDILEMPVSGMLLEREGKRAWRPFAPSRSVTQVPMVEQPPGINTPVVSMYVSHSYQLLEVHREHHEERGDITFFGPDVDEARVDLLAQTLSGFATRPGARSATFEEINERAISAWDDPGEKPVDPLPVLLSSGQSAIVHMSRQRPLRPVAPVVQRPPLDHLLSDALPTWREANILAWTPDHHPARRLVAGIGARIQEANTGSLEQDPSGSLAELRSAVDDTAMFDGAIAIDVLHTVQPDNLIDVLQWLHDHLNPGAMLAVRVPTDLIGERTVNEQPRFCAATYMTAFRRAGFGFARLDRMLIDESDPTLIQARERMRFHDPLELRTAGVDALLVRPDQSNLADLALTDPDG